MQINQIQNRQLSNLAIIVSLLAGAAAVLAYIDTKKHRKLEQELITLNKQIKELELQKLKKDNGIA